MCLTDSFAAATQPKTNDLTALTANLMLLSFSQSLIVPTTNTLFDHHVHTAIALILAHTVNSAIAAM
jgi:hypothetical protein